MRTLCFSLLLAGLALFARPAAAQEGGQPVKPTPTTRYIMKDGAVVQRQGGTTTALDANIRLPNGTKVNVKSGIVELPGGKITTLHEGDYVKADGGIVFATPASAASARGAKATPADAKFSTFVIQGTEPRTPARKIQLLNQKIELLNQKVTLLSKGQPASAEVTAIDQQLQEMDAQLASEGGTPDK